MTRTRIEADREDLMAEAVNLRERIELKVPGIDHPVTIGCNDLGHWSFYFGPEPMCRFDSDAQLRRAVRGGQLYRTQGAPRFESDRSGGVSRAGRRGPSSFERRSHRWAV